MHVARIELVDFRNYRNATFDLSDGVTAIVGANGQGKTNLVEALSYLATLDSFRDAPSDALVRSGSDTAIVRAVVVHEDGREITVEAEIQRTGRNRVQINKQRLARTRELLGVVRVTVFSPDDLELVKAGPAGRRRFMDAALVALALKNDRLRLDLERVLKQRNTLLKQAGGRLSDEIGTTLDVWDAQLAEVGEQLGRARAAFVARLSPLLQAAYEQLAGAATAVEAVYEPAWRQRGLAAALAAARVDDVRRGVSTVGPHRDELDLSINAMPARTHASQGEQRTLALALRLAAHRLVTERTEMSPVLVLDDVLSELDPSRCAALLANLPPGQVLITTAGRLPDAAHPDHVVRIRADVMN